MDDKEEVKKLQMRIIELNLKLSAAKEREKALREALVRLSTWDVDLGKDHARKVLLTTVDPERYKANEVDWFLGEVPLEKVPVTKACGKEDCKYSFARCGRTCFECHQTMRDFGD